MFYVRRRLFSLFLILNANRSDKWGITGIIVFTKDFMTIPKDEIVGRAVVFMLIGGMVKSQKRVLEAQLFFVIFVVFSKKTIQSQAEVKLKGLINCSLNKVFVLVVCALVISGSPAFTAGGDAAKKYAPILGAYEFFAEGQTMTIKFWVDEEKLWGAPEGETRAELTPMEGEAWKFEVTTDEGQYFVLEFVKDESGKFNKCVIQTMGMEIEGTRIEE